MKEKQSHLERAREMREHGGYMVDDICDEYEQHIWELTDFIKSLGFEEWLNDK